MAGANYKIELTNAEMNCYEAMKEFQEEFVPGKLACVRAGLSGGFKDTHKLHIMKYDEAMATPKAAQWTKSIHE